MYNYTNTANEVHRRKLPQLKCLFYSDHKSEEEKKRLLKYFNIPMDKQEDFKLWIEYYLWNAQTEGYKTGQHDLKSAFKQLFDLQDPED